MSDERLTTTQKLDLLIEFYRRVDVERNGPDKILYVGGSGISNEFTTYGRTIEEAIERAYETWRNRRVARAVKDLLR